MASVVYTSTLARWMKGDVPLDTSAGLKMMILETVTTTPDNKDHDFVNDIAADEFDDAGDAYTAGFGNNQRLALAFTGTTNQANSVETDLTNDRAEWHFDDLTWTSLGGTDSVIGSAVIQEVTSDSDSPLISFHDFGDTVTDGTDFTLQVGAEGAIQLASA